MEPQSPGPSGLLGNLRGFADGLLGSAHDRLQLLAIELHEEKHRLIQLLFWVSALVALALLVIVFCSLALVVLFWDTARVPVVISLAALYLIGLGLAVFAFRRFLQRQTKPFAATLAELRADRECFRTGS